MVDLMPSEIKAAIRLAAAEVLRSSHRGYVIDDMAGLIAERAAEALDTANRANRRAFQMEQPNG